MSDGRHPLNRPNGSFLPGKDRSCDGSEASQSLEEVSFLSRPDVQHRVTVLNQAIENLVATQTGEPAVLYDAARHILTAGGKRLRSLLVVFSCEAVGGCLEDAIPFAVSVELLQTASLIHDDIVDDDNMRRGVETTHRVFGNKIAVIAGDLLVGLALRTIGKLATPEVLVRIGEAGIKMCEGEVADFLLAPDRSRCVTVDEYLRVVQNKTASFMRETAVVGAAMGEGTEAQQEAIGKYGELLGFAFQLRDDVLDIRSDQDTTGKTVRSDLRNSRCSYPLVYALGKIPEGEAKACLASLHERDMMPAMRAISRTGAVEKATELAKSYVQQAKDALLGFGFRNEELLRALADFAIDRLY